MAYVVAIIAPGEMGSAVGARLAERGVRVTTALAGRSLEDLDGLWKRAKDHETRQVP